MTQPRLVWRYDATTATHVGSIGTVPVVEARSRVVGGEEVGAYRLHVLGASDDWITTGANPRGAARVAVANWFRALRLHDVARAIREGTE